MLSVVKSGVTVQLKYKRFLEEIIYATRNITTVIIFFSFVRNL